MTHRPRHATARERRTPSRRLVTGLVCALAGFMIVSSAISARGTDLRPDRNTDLVGLLNSEKDRNANLARQVSALREEVDRLTAERQPPGDTEDQLRELQQLTGLVAVRGPALTVTLTDAPPEVQPPGVDADELIVHQQDIQAVVNAMWAGGAEAMTIQGQRVIATTGIKCVGNTVVLHGVPYAPPYVITAIGDPGLLAAALKASPYLQIYQQYVQVYGLGWEQRASEDMILPGYDGSVGLEHARVPGSGATPGP
ncbi:DUF881 domain-containing protein [Propionibacteriaceae bacterium Y2011]|uniref:DUF881 domain-containing protein n=1 Tax=Microlunatus sp. Y2014 TaxID=3418488 RepID=UPI003B465B7B